MGFRDRKQLKQRLRDSLRANNSENLEEILYGDIEEEFLNIFENEIGYDPDASEFAGETAFVVPVAPLPSPLRRPTRTEAEAAYRKSYDMPSCVEAFGHLFGGFAPGPIEVPKLCLGREWNEETRKRVPCASDAPDAVVRLATEDELEAAFARSNAWEEIKKRQKRAIELLSGAPSICIAVSALETNLTFMTAPQMGIGPKEES